MPKLPAFPKAPAANASLAVWKKYEERVKAVAKKRKEISDSPKAKAAIKARINALKSKG